MITNRGFINFFLIFFIMFLVIGLFLSAVPGTTLVRTSVWDAIHRILDALYQRLSGAGDNTDTVPTKQPSGHQVVTATGVYNSGKYSVKVSLTFPLDGGGVTGSFSGDCGGKIDGNYVSGVNSGAGLISGNAHGTCSPFIIPIPASGTFSGSVGKSQRSFTISGSGKAAGFSGSGSVMMRY